MTEGAGLDSLLRSATVALTVPVPGSADPELGTGFLVAPGIIATCAHVLLPARGPGKLPPTVRVRQSGADAEVLVDTNEGWLFHDEADLAFLPAPAGLAVPAALLGSEIAAGDDLWTYGHPAGKFRAGQPAGVTYQGASHASQPATAGGESRTRELGRVYGVPVGGGFSGSPVLNRRTGAVAGMLSTSDLAGSAHMVPAEVILAALERVCGCRPQPGGNAGWLDALSDEQIHEGGWRHPGPRLRGYLEAVRRRALAVRHLSALRNAAPPLLAVHVRQQVRPEARTAAEPVMPRSIQRQAATGLHDVYVSLPGDGAHGPDPVGRVAAGQMLAGDDDVLLIGGPGAGKSTLLRTMAHDSAGRWLDGAVESWVPVRVLASDLVERRALPEAILAGVESDLGGLIPGEGWPAAFFAAQPVPGVRWLVLVDGVDEITDAAARSDVLTTIAGMATGEQRSTYRFMLATRRLSAAELEFGRWDPRRYELQPFTPEDLAGFAGAWFAALGRPGQSAAVRDFLAEVDRVKVDELARTPLMAAILCQVFADSPDQKLPDRRPQAYEQFVTRSYRRQYDAEFLVGVKKALGRYPAVLDAANRVLGKSEALMSRLADARLDGDPTRAVDLIASWCGENPPAYARAAWTAFLEDLLRRNGLLAEQGGDFRFIHQTFTEYLAARHVASDPARSAAEYRRIFGRWTRTRRGRRRWIPPSTADDSYNAFVIAAWQQETAMAAKVRRALTRAATRGALEGCQFVVDQKALGIEVDARTSDTVVKELVAGGIRRPWHREWSLSSYERRYGRSLSETLVLLLGDQAAEPLTALAKRSRKGKIRVEAAEALHDLNPETTLDLLRAAALEGNTFLAGRIRFGEFDAMMALARRLHDQGDTRAADLAAAAVISGFFDGGAALKIADLLVEFGDERGIAVLDMLTEVGDDDDRIEAAEELAKLDGNRGADAFARLARSADDESYRAKAAEKLAELKDPRAADALVRLARSADDEFYRAKAAEKLAELKDPRAADALAARIADPETSTYRRLRAAKTLLERGDKRGAAYLGRLLSDGAFAVGADRDFKAEIQIEAAKALAGAGIKKGEQVLVRYASDPGCRYQVEAATTLKGRLFGYGNDLLAAIAATAEDPRKRWDAVQNLSAKDSRAMDLRADLAADLSRTRPSRSKAREHYRLYAQVALRMLRDGDDDRGTDHTAIILADPGYYKAATAQERRQDTVSAWRYLARMSTPRAVALRDALAAENQPTSALRDLATQARARLAKTPASTSRTPRRVAAPEGRPAPGPVPPGSHADKLAQVRRDKESAVDAQDFSRAAALRNEEKELLAAGAGQPNAPYERTEVDEIVANAGRQTSAMLRVLSTAFAEAIRSAPPRLRPHHLLLAILSEPRCVAAQILSAASGEDPATLAADFTAQHSATRDEGESGAVLPQRPGTPVTVREVASEVLGLLAGATPEIPVLGEPPAATDFLLLALLGEPGGEVSGYLRRLGLNRDRLIHDNIALRTGRQVQETADGTPEQPPEPPSRTPRRVVAPEGRTAPGPVPPGSGADKLAQVRRDKESAVDAQDFGRATALRNEEKPPPASGGQQNAPDERAAEVDEIVANAGQQTSAMLRVLSTAFAEAIRSAPPRLRPHHLLLAILSEPRSVAAQILSAASGEDPATLAADFTAQHSATRDEDESGAVLAQRPGTPVTIGEVASEVLGLLAGATLLPMMPAATDFLLLALLGEPGGEVSGYLTRRGLNRDRLIDYIVALRTGRQVQEAADGAPEQPPEPPSRTAATALDMLGHDLVQAARNRPPTAGNEVDRIVTRLGRKLARPRRYAVLRVSTSTAPAQRAVEALARSIADGKAPKPLAAMPFISLDLDALRAGQHSDMPSKQMQYLFMDLRRLGPAVLYVEGLLDNIGSSDPASGFLLLFAVMNPQLRVITAATREQLRGFIPGVGKQLSKFIPNLLGRLVLRRYVSVIRFVPEPGMTQTVGNREANFLPPGLF